MVAQRFKRKIAEMYFSGHKSPPKLRHLAPARGETFCDKDMSLKLGGF
jgi:hypothetical protein